MTAVPKLNYANLRGKSKSKDSQFSQRKIENNSSDLFSHMNQDNLKYIQSQIKQKNRRSNQITLKKKTEQAVETVNDRNYPEKIEQKQSKYEQTERQINEKSGDLHTKILKTQGESVKLSQNIQFEAPSKKVSEEAETNKLSYYDLVSQAKSKRVSSIQAYYEQENQGYANSKETGAFLNFLSGYIEDLNVKKNDKKQKKKINMNKHHGELEKQRQKINSVSISSTSQRQIIKNSLVEEKINSACLAKQIEQYRIEQQNRNKRIDMLQKYVIRLDEEVRQLRSLINHSKKSQAHKSQIENMNIYEHRIDTSHLSHRKNLTSFSLTSNDRLNRNKQAEKELNQLERQYQLFRETGECRLTFGEKRPLYD